MIAAARRIRPARRAAAARAAAGRALVATLAAAARALVATRAAAVRAWAWTWPRLRPWLARFFAALAATERWLRVACGAAARTATQLGAVVTPARAIAAAALLAGLCLVASQFIDYRAVEVGRAAYASLPAAASPPSVAARTAGQAHAYLLVPLGLLAALAAAAALRRSRPRRLGLAIAALGLVALAVILVVDLPAGLDAGHQTSRFAGAVAVLRDGFYAELAAAAGLVLAGLLYYARPCRIPINSSGRAASARRRRPRRRASSRARVARSA